MEKGRSLWSLFYFCREKYIPLYDRKTFKEVFIVKKFLRGIMLWVVEIIELPISLICFLFVLPFIGVYRRVSGEVDSFKEYWAIVGDVLTRFINLKIMVMKYGISETFRKLNEE